MTLDVGGYPFEGPFVETKDLKNVPGLYAVHSRRGDNYLLLDLGEAAAVRDRLREHERHDCWVRNSRGGLIAFSASSRPTCRPRPGCTSRR